MKNLKLILVLMFATMALAASDPSAPIVAPGDDRGPVRTLDDQCIVDLAGYVYGTYTGSTQWPSGDQVFRLAAFCFVTSGCPSLPDTFYTYCGDLDHEVVQIPYCVDINECVVDPAYPTVVPAMAYVLTTYNVVDAQTDRIKQLALWKLTVDHSGGPNNGIPFVNINDGRGYPNLGDTPVYPYINTVYNTDPLNNDPANAVALDALGYDAALSPTFAKNVVNCGDELLIAADPVVIGGGFATICATITLVRGANAVSLGNTSASGVWVDFAELNGFGTLSAPGGFTDASGQVQVCITQPVSDFYHDVRLQVCSRGVWPKKLDPCEGEAQSQVLINGTVCEVCSVVDIPGDSWLPVELTSFSAVGGVNSIQIAWRTASESELDRFEVLRNGVPVYQVSARNNALGATYGFVDRDVEVGVAYNYELVCQSLDGTRSIMATASASPHLGSGAVSEFSLSQNYPNPFNPQTTISFSLPEASDVTLTVFNVSGQEVATLVNGNLSAGSHTVNFDGASLTSGVYLYRLTAGSFTAQKKMVLMK